MKRLLLLTLVVALAGCAVQQRARMKDGQVYGVTDGIFRARWWNYYERGRSFADGAFFDEAIADFESAVSGRADDQWRARTYGMHFVDYFPHRELGIVHLRRNDPEAAIRELETSLRSAESARAKFYLNDARRRFLKKSGLDRRAPRIRFAGDGPPPLTNRFVVRISGDADDDRFVASLTVADRPAFLELSSKTFHFDMPVRLREGSNSIRVVAEDLTGKRTTRAIDVTADYRGPVISIDKAEKIGDAYRVRGVVYDMSGVAAFRINGRELPARGDRSLPFDEVLPGSRLRIEAQDAAGNATTAEIPLVKKAMNPPGRTRFAALGIAESMPVTEIVDDAGPPRLAGAPGEADDDAPPVIRLERLADDQDVFDAEILIEGRVTGHAIERVRVNGEEVFQKGGTMLFFSRLVSLAEGENRFEIEAVDGRGRRALREIRIVRRLQKVRQIGSRLRVALIPMAHGGRRGPVGDAFYGALVAALIEQGRFNLVEREKMDALLREAALADAKLTDPETAVRLGRFVSAEASLAGRVVERGGGVEVIAALIDTESSEVLATNDVYDEKADFESLGRLAEMLSYKFKRDLPLVEGQVVAVEGKEITVDLGKKRHVCRNMGLILFEPGPSIRHPVTGRLLGSETIPVGQARIEDVFPLFSKAAVTEKAEDIRVMAQVITK